MDHLGVGDATLFMSDWGGPIGLDFARREPSRVDRLVIANAWCWPVNRDPHFIFFSSIMRSPLGQYLIQATQLLRQWRHAEGDRGEVGDLG